MSQLTRNWRRTPGIGAIVCVSLGWLTTPAAQQATGAAPPPTHATPVGRLLITDTMVIYGNGRPAFGPVDVLAVNGLITYIGPMSPEERIRQLPDAVIDADGRYVMPGLVNTHMHWHEWRVPDIPQPIQYERNLYLAAGVTTTRELGGDFDKSMQWKSQSEANTIVAPRMIVFDRPNLGRHSTIAEIRTAVREAKRKGADGLKIGGLDRDQLEALMSEAKTQGLPTTTHIGVEETTAIDYVELGVDSIEHFYGIGDAALDGVQDFPADMNYDNEIHRFALAGELLTQADPERLRAVVEMMAARKVAWSPTLSIYEASRDLIRAQNQPWFEEYLHPSVGAFFEPSLSRHGSYFIGWTNTHQTRWRRSYRVWMNALRQFARAGGLITTGDDAGYIYSLYGFGLVRELELHEEAGFHPLEVITHATVNGAALLGLGDRVGRVRVGYAADLLVVNGNPLADLSLLNPYGTGVNVDNRNVHGGGIAWTIKDGIPYHVPTLLGEVKQMVTRARAAAKPAPTAGRN